jgi:hypothetical protein
MHDGATQFEHTAGLHSTLVRYPSLVLHILARVVGDNVQLLIPTSPLAFANQLI